jgi:aerobic C4-dicarboxylate transport protein
MATATALVNVVGNTMAVFAISRWEGAFDAQAFTRETGARAGNSCLKLEKRTAQATAAQSN